MTVLKRYILRLFMSQKYITANVIDRNNGRIVATSSSVEHAIKKGMECGRTNLSDNKAASVVGEVLAMRLRVEGLDQGLGRGIHVDVDKAIEKKGFKVRSKVWAIVDSLKAQGIKIVIENDSHGPPETPPPGHGQLL